MDVDASLLLPLLGLLVLTILITGPGLWSDQWGWWWLKRRDRTKRDR